MTWIGLIIIFYFSIKQNKAGSIAGDIANYFSYFTIQSNILVALYFTLTVHRIGSKSCFFTSPIVKGAIALYITMTGLIYYTLLRGLLEMHGIFYIGNFILHYITPIAYLFDWLNFGKKIRYKWIYALYWLIYPTFFYVYTIIRGRQTNFYPYPFLDVGKLGLENVILNSLILTGLFLGCGLLLIGVNNLFYNFKREKFKQHFKG
jgi:hypothetical protein